MRTGAIDLVAFGPQHIEEAITLSRQAKWPHRSEDWHLVLELSAGAEPMLERDRDKNPVVALREIAAKLIKPEEAKEDYIRSLQKHAEVDEPEEARPDSDDAREDSAFRQVTEEELLRALTTEAQRRAEPQPEPEADYEE